ncbi:MAG: CCA tRNA nucleotidyltransferase [Candidatus Aenigmarchaeota archaeon]|nr:CCA tRNA nucleotidyltransferase [Candidatus Aenigmarchaeota archaeon]
MMQTSVLLKKVIKKITPNFREEKKIKTLSSKLLCLANSIASAHGGHAILAGSLTRDTWLPNKNEIDIFILFPKNLTIKQLEELGLELGKKTIEAMKGKWRIEYAQHPYIRGEIEGITVDIVPCYKLEKGEKIISAVDRTQFHVQYLEGKLPKKASKEVRLLKQFLKANDLYGADAKTNGFSGYLCELLIIYYKSFVNLLKSVTKWRVKEIIDIENQWKKEDYHHLKKKFKDEVLIVIDPVDKERNVAAALSAYNFFKFKKLAEEFLKEPKEEFFFPKKKAPLTPKELENLMKIRGSELMAIFFRAPQVVPDILWPQLRRATKRLEGILREYEFSVLKSGCWTDEKSLAVIILEMQVSRLPNIDKIIGPPIFDEKNAKNFALKHKNDVVAGPYVEDNFWVIECYRKWTSAKAKLVDSISEKEEILLAKGIPNFIAKQLSLSFEVGSIEEIKKYLRKNKDFGVFMRKYFEGESLI